MSVSYSEGSMENLFDFEQLHVGIETNKVQILEEINRELEAYLARECNDQDLKDGVFDLLSSISDSVQEEFDKLISGDSDKKHFLQALSRISALLLNTKIQKAEKIKRILKIAIETTIKIWQELKQQ